MPEVSSCPNFSDMLSPSGVPGCKSSLCTSSSNRRVVPANHAEPVGYLYTHATSMYAGIAAWYKLSESSSRRLVSSANTESITDPTTRMLLPAP